MVVATAERSHYLFAMTLSEFFSNYFTVRDELRVAVRDLTPEQLAWTCHQHPGSVGQLLGHIAENEAFWISAVAKGETVDFSRFENLTGREDLLAVVDEYAGVMRDFLEHEHIENWDRVFYRYVEDNQEEKFSQRWLIWHVVEHQARHRGQIFMLMRMQGLDVPNV